MTKEFANMVAQSDAEFGILEKNLNNLKLFINAQGVSELQRGSNFELLSDSLAVSQNLDSKGAEIKVVTKKLDTLFSELCTIKSSIQTCK